VLAIPAHRHATLAAGGPGLIGGELVRGALLVRRTPASPSDLSLLFAVHSRESASFTPLHGTS
jgi:hypothetical protein